MTWKELKELADTKSDYLETVPDGFMKEVYKAQNKLYRQLVDFSSDFDTEDGSFVNNQANIKKINKLDSLFNDYQQTVIYTMIVGMIGRLQETVKLNINYHTTMLQFSYDLANTVNHGPLASFNTKFAAGVTELKPITATIKKVNNVVNARLGLTTEGALIPNGYLYNVYTNTISLNYSREALYKAVVTKMPVDDFKKSLKEDVTGLMEKLPDETIRVVKNGILAKEYSVISNEVFAKVDRTASTIIKDDFDLRYFIYGGTIIKTTRPFCKIKCNKVFSTDQAKEWADEVPGPISIDKDTYDAVVDMGGINCRHSPLFISLELYEVLKEEGSDLIPG